MKLIDLLVQELAKRGGWPKFERELQAVQDADSEIKFHFFGHPLAFELNNPGNWGSNTPAAWLEDKQAGSNIDAETLAVDHATAIITRDQYEAALVASKQLAWNGEGLPPVGCECEAYDGASWYPVVVVGQYDGFAFAWNYDHRVTFTVNEIDSNNFRRISTEAERKREEAINDIASLIGRGTFCDDAAGIYDAISSGKIAGVKLD